MKLGTPKLGHGMLPTKPKPLVFVASPQVESLRNLPKGLGLSRYRYGTARKRPQKEEMKLRQRRSLAPRSWQPCRERLYKASGSSQRLNMRLWP